MYYLKLWNGKWGNAIRFVVFNPATNKYTEYSPVHLDDILWVDIELSNLSIFPEYSTWIDCENYPIENLGDAAV